MRRATLAVVAALAVGILVTSVGFGYEAWGRDPDDAPVLGPGAVTVTLDIEHSRFATERLRVAPGTTVTFEVVNHDPIHHELIVGDEEVHRRHEHGTEAEHPPVPGEVSVGPLETATTVFHFHEAGTVEFACHLPGHVAYGMVGAVVVSE